MPGRSNHQSLTEPLQQRLPRFRACSSAGAEVEVDELGQVLRFRQGQRALVANLPVVTQVQNLEVGQVR
jgi:hypothetical protein